MPKNGEYHHCGCGIISKKSAKMGGYCSNCHERCEDEHPWFFFRRGEGCKLCREAAERASKAAREKKQQDKDNQDAHDRAAQDAADGIKGGKGGKRRGKK